MFEGVFEQIGEHGKAQQFLAQDGKAVGLAGGLAWSYGEAPTLLMLIYVMHRWFREDTTQAAAADRRADAHGDPELDAYNDYLTRLHQKDT